MASINKISSKTFKRIYLIDCSNVLFRTEGVIKDLEKKLSRNKDENYLALRRYLFYLFPLKTQDNRNAHKSFIAELLYAYIQARDFIVSGNNFKNYTQIFLGSPKEKIHFNWRKVLRSILKDFITNNKEKYIQWTDKLLILYKSDSSRANITMKQYISNYKFPVITNKLIKDTKDIDKLLDMLLEVFEMIFNVSLIKYARPTDSAMKRVVELARDKKNLVALSSYTATEAIIPIIQSSLKNLDEKWKIQVNEKSKLGEYYLVKSSSKFVIFGVNTLLSQFPTGKGEHMQCVLDMVDINGISEIVLISDTYSDFTTWRKFIPTQIKVREILQTSNRGYSEW